MAVDLARLGTDGEHGRRVQAVEGAARRRIVGLGVAGPPIDEVELGIVRARAPRRRPAVQPRVGAGGPRLVAGLAGPRDRVAAPQLLAGRGVPAVEEAAGGGLAAGHPRDEDPVGHDGGARRVVALRPVGELLVPQLLAGLHVEGEDVVVDGHPEETALVDHRPAPVEAAAPPRSLLEDDRRAPDLPARLQVDGERPAPVDGVENPVVDGRRGELARLVHHAGAPDGHEPMEVGLVDLVEGTVALAVVPHAVDEHVLGGLRIVQQIFRRLGGTRVRPQPQEDRKQSCRLLHDQPLIGPRPSARAAGDRQRREVLRVLRRRRRRRPPRCGPSYGVPAGRSRGDPRTRSGRHACVDRCIAASTVRLDPPQRAGSPPRFYGADCGRMGRVGSGAAKAMRSGPREYRGRRYG